MMQNLGSNPKISCNAMTDAMIMTGFLYLNNFSFMINSILN